MGIDRTMVSAKLSRENVDFLDDRQRSLRPYEVSVSSLVNLCVRIVRELHAKGELSLEPEQLQKLLGLDRSDILATLPKRRTTWRGSGSPSFEPKK